MNGILDGSLVCIALLLSVGYALLSLGPRSLRRTLLATLSLWLGRVPAVPKSQGACGGCDDCGTTAAGATESPTSDAPATEVRVPVAKIGRRARGA
jgi:hypothetical protein